MSEATNEFFLSPSQKKKTQVCYHK